MKFSQFTLSVASAVLVIPIIAGSRPVPAHAQTRGARGETHTAHVHRPADDRTTNDLVRVAREATERFRDVSVAEREGYGLLFGCVSGSDYGAMGLHYVNLSLVGDGELDPMRPEVVIYEPLPNGKLKLVGADYLVFAEQWHAKHTETPKLMGQLLHLFESPNRYGLPAFYTLHVWAWKDNPNGAFVNWHPKVSCDAYRAPGQ